VAQIGHGVLPFITNKATAGTLTITGGTVSCEYDPNAQPPIGGNSMFTTANGASVTFQGTSFSNCTAPADGVAIVNSGNTNGDLNLLGTTFTNIHAINQGNGGCIAHGSGNLTITGGSFTGCRVDDGGIVPGSGNGQGGAIYMTNAGGTSRVAISGVTFQANVAGSSGGAIYLTGTDAIAIDTSAFQANIANGNTFDTGNAELGGGAIFASNTATGSNDGNTPGINASAFLIFQTSFIGNLAPNGTGGAILLSNGGKLTYGTLTLNFGDYQTGVVGSIPGGIIASNFSANIASGSWDTVNNGALDPRAGSGGAVYASGYVSILASSFVGGNTSTSGSGGAIAYRDASDSFTPLAITNTTINGNSAGATGGGIANLIDKGTSNAGKVTLINDTIVGNTATGTGGGFFNGNSTAAEINVTNTIVANNVGSSGNENCGGSAFTDGGGNLQFSPDATCGTMTVGDPVLDAAAPFGGINALVFVMKLGSTSAAQGIGIQATCTASPVSDLDAALNSRPDGKPNCDSGAYESSALTPVTLQSFEVD
jgi:predicted outer membrane repeat protein